MCNKTEHWAIFPEDPRYSVSDLGNIKNNKTGHITKGTIKTSHRLPYYRFKLGKKGKYVGVHYMVLASFVAKPEGECVCDHINRNTLDNRLENLRWVTVRTNTLNSSYRTIYVFLGGEYLGSFAGWQEAADFIGVNADYLRKRCNGNDARYKTTTINGYTVTTEKRYRTKSGYKRFIILDNAYNI